MSQKYDLTYYTQEHVNGDQTRDQKWYYIIHNLDITKSPIIGTKPKCESGKLENNMRKTEHRTHPCANERIKKWDRSSVLFPYIR